MRPGALLLLTLLAGPAGAGAAEAPDPLRLRDELRAMEALLDSTVEQVSRPNPGFYLAGSPSCRGYLLKGYGFVFVLPARWLPVRQATFRSRRSPGRGSAEGVIVISGDRRDPGLVDLERQVRMFQEEAEREREEAERNFEEMTRELRARLTAAEAAWGDGPPSPALPVLAPAPPAAPTPSEPTRAETPPSEPAEPAKPPTPSEPGAPSPFPPAGPLASGAPWRHWVEREPQDTEDKGPERLVAAVRDAVIAALEAHGPSLSSLRSEETISVVVDFVAGSPFLDDEARPARSLTLRVRKRDLDERRAGRLTPEELRRRVEAVEY